MARASGMASATFVAVMSISGSAFAEESKPKSSGGPTWTSGLGLVELSPKAEEAKAEDKPAPSAAALPPSSVSAFVLRAFVGMDKVAGSEDFRPAFGGALRFEARHLRSLFAPWVDGSFGMTLPDGDKQLLSTFYDVALRGGIDVHPARISNIAIGPFIGYRQIHTVTQRKTPEDSPTASSMLQGADVGGQIHVRSSEVRTDTEVERPLFDGIAYTFVQTASVTDTNNVFVGALASYGSGFRVFTNVEGCASDSATCFPRQLRMSAGLGGMW